jgi:hypothetical protein
MTRIGVWTAALAIFTACDGGGGGGSLADGAPGGGDGMPGGADSGSGSDGGPGDGGPGPDGGGGGGGNSVFDDRPSCAIPSNNELIDLGHVVEVDQIERSGDRMVSVSFWGGEGQALYSGRWILWDAATGLRVAHGVGADTVALAGSTLAVQLDNRIALRSSATGALLGSVPATTLYVSYGLATDGSYLWQSPPGGPLTVWSPSGELLWQREGDYFRRHIFAGSDELRIGGGPEGDDVVEILQVAGGAQSTTPSFNGAFGAWFSDGERFITRTGNTTWIYSRDAVQERIFDLPVTGAEIRPMIFGGVGDVFWRRVGTNLQPRVEVYRVAGDGTAEVIVPMQYSFDTVFSDDECVGVLRSGFGEADLVRLGPGPMQAQTAEAPVANLGVAACAGAALVLGNLAGAVVAVDPAGELDPSRLTCGNARDIAGSHAGVAAIATASGEILVVDAEDETVSSSRILNSSEVHLSDDGTVLATAGNRHDAQYWPDQSAHIFSVVAGQEWQELGTFPGSFGGTSRGQDALDLSRDGAWFAGRAAGERFISDVTGATVVAGDPTVGHYRIETDANLYAVHDSSEATQIYQDGILIGAADGTPLDWVNPDRLLVQREEWQGDSLVTVTDVVDQQGNWLRTMELESQTTDRTTISTVPGQPSWIYTELDHRIVDVETGDVVWSAARPAANPGRGAVAGSRIIYLDRTFVRTAPY